MRGARGEGQLCSLSPVEMSPVKLSSSPTEASWRHQLPAPRAPWGRRTRQSGRFTGELRLKHVCWLQMEHSGP